MSRTADPLLLFPMERFEHPIAIKLSYNLEKLPLFCSLPNVSFSVTDPPSCTFGSLGLQFSFLKSENWGFNLIALLRTSMKPGAKGQEDREI